MWVGYFSLLLKWLLKQYPSGNVKLRNYSVIGILGVTVPGVFNSFLIKHLLSCYSGLHRAGSIIASRSN